MEGIGKVKYFLWDQITQHLALVAVQAMAISARMSVMRPAAAVVIPATGMTVKMIFLTAVMMTGMTVTMKIGVTGGGNGITTMQAGMGKICVIGGLVMEL